MRPIWLETYAFLPSAQIELLLEKYFSASALERFQNQSYQYRKIDGDGVLVYVEKDEEIYIDKLYLPHSQRGKDLPKQVFDALLQKGKDLTLNVNQNNVRAVRCYLKNGFIVEQEIIIDLGNGMKNCDYVMRKRANK
jgi:ribosomal protein S18 acetylase RimI-like enzyme